MTQRLYSELSDSERENLINQYKGKYKKTLNIYLIIFIVTLIVLIGGVIFLYNNKNLITGEEMIDDYLRQYINMIIVAVVIFFIPNILINIFKRKKPIDVNSNDFKKFLNKNNITLDKIDNQSDKSI